MNKNLLNAIVIIVVIFVVMNIMHDMTSTSNEEQAITYKSYIDVEGNVASLDEFTGDYLWIDYAAQWCSYCAAQTQIIKSLDKKMGDTLLFVTVITGTDKVMEPPTAEHARSWARRFNLDPNRVLAKFSTDTLPYHILYSPSGKVLYQGSGLYNEGKIKAIIAKYTQIPE